MAKVETKNKQNPKLVQTVLKDGRASLALEYYLGRSESPVVDEDGNQVFYIDGAIAGKPKYKIKHNRKRENLNLYIWVHPRSQVSRRVNREGTLNEGGKGLARPLMLEAVRIAKTLFPAIKIEAQAYLR